MIKGIDILPGDFFCARGAWGIGTLIRAVERIHSRDNEAKYGHSGLIVDENGTTLEALWTVQHGQIDAYRGQDIIIARPVRNTAGKVIESYFKGWAIRAIKNRHLGQPYPFWRLPLFLFPVLAKFVSVGRYVVCSELTAEYLSLIDARGRWFSGVNPDTIADEAKAGKCFEIIYEGEWR